jgi:hypothetical protein
MLPPTVFNFHQTHEAQVCSHHCIRVRAVRQSVDRVWYDIEVSTYGIGYR